jgi:N-sulfoglucosamine sulfohydrolase
MRSCFTYRLLQVATPAADRPNLLLITVDDMNRDSVGAYGGPIPDITPNIDRLASQRARVDHGFVDLAVCTTCRAGLTAGRYPQTGRSPVVK